MFKWLKNIKKKNLDNIYKRTSTDAKILKKEKELSYKASNNDEFYNSKSKYILYTILFIQISLFLIILFILLYKASFINNYLKYIIFIVIILIAISNLSNAFIDKTKYVDTLVLTNKELIISLLDSKRKTVTKPVIYKYKLDNIKLYTKTIRSEESFLDDNYIFIIKEKKHKERFYVYPSKDTELYLWSFIINTQLLLQKKDITNNKEFQKLYKNIFKGR